MITTKTSNSTNNLPVALGSLLALICLTIASSQQSGAAEPLDTWRAIQPPTTESLYDIAYGNNTFVAVGDSGTLLTSTDGSTWSTESSGVSTTLSSVSYANNSFIAVGNSGVILTSENGSTWTSQNSGSTDSFRGIAYGNNTYVVVGHGATLTSSNGTTWQSHESGTSGYLSGVTYGNGTFIAVGANGTIVASSTGTTWSGVNSGVDDYLNAIIYADNIFVAVGGGKNGGSTVLTSINGNIWTTQATSSTNFLNGIAFGGNTFVATGYSGELLSSTDGTAWTAKNSGISNALYAPAFGRNTFVAVGWEGTVIQSDTLTRSLTDFTAIVENSTVSLSWEPMAEVSGYSLYYGFTPGSQAGEFELGNKTSARFPNIPYGDYYLVLVAQGTSGESTKSEEIKVTVGLTPPTGLAASVNGNTVSLSWEPVPRASGYSLYYGFSTDSHNQKVDLGPDTSVDFNNIPDGEYYLVMTAYDGSGESGVTAEIMVSLPGIADDPQSSNTGTVGIGRECTEDTDCESGMRCLNSLVFVDVKKYCTIPCNTSNECSVLQDSSYGLLLEAKLAADNIYNMERLFRGVGCYTYDDSPHVGDDHGESQAYCLFNCPDNSAMAANEDGRFETCKAMPNYKTVERGTYQGPDYEVAIAEFVWQPEVECSIFKPCPANNEVCAGDNSCIMGRNLEGSCYSFKSGDLIEDCLLQCSYDCDEGCMSTCYSGTTSSSGLERCADKCCKSDNPVCN